MLHDIDAETDACIQCGADSYLCQGCGKVLCPVEHPPKAFEAFLKSNGQPGTGNLCPTCRAGKTPMTEESWRVARRVAQEKYDRAVQEAQHVFDVKKAEAWQVFEAEIARLNTVQIQKKPILELLGKDGNAFSILGKAARVAKENGMDWEAIHKEATEGDYNRLLATMMKYFEVV